MCISEGHKTTANILARKAFTVSMATAEQMVACDYVGIESGNQVADKVVKAGWHTTKSEFVDAPLIDELPMAVECRLVSYDPESCRLVGEIVNVSADESVLDEDGKKVLKNMVDQFMGFQPVVIGIHPIITSFPVMLCFRFHRICSARPGGKREQYGQGPARPSRVYFRDLYCFQSRSSPASSCWPVHCVSLSARTASLRAALPTPPLRR